MVLHRFAISHDLAPIRHESRLKSFTNSNFFWRATSCWPVASMRGCFAFQIKKEFLRGTSELMRWPESRPWKKTERNSGISAELSRAFRGLRRCRTFHETRMQHDKKRECNKIKFVPGHDRTERNSGRTEGIFFREDRPWLWGKSPQNMHSCSFFAQPLIGRGISSRKT